MKKLFLITICFSMMFGKLFAQDKADDGKFRFGLKIAPSIAWMRPDDKKKLLSDGAGLKFAYGLVTEFRLTSVASFCTGVEVNYTGGRLNFANQPILFITIHQNILCLLQVPSTDFLYLKENIRLLMLICPFY